MSDVMTVRTAALADADAILALEHLCFVEDRL